MSSERDSYSGRDNLEAMQQATRYNRFLVDLSRRHAAGDTVLDHGAGAGTFAKPMAEGGARVLCMEPDDGLRTELANAGLAVAATLEEIDEASVDYAYTLNVLEHVEDDRGAMQQLHRCLRPGGRLLVYVPAFQLLYSQMDTHVGHFRRYRRQPLVRDLRSAGFDVVSARYVDSLGFLATLVYKLVGDRSGRISSSSVAAYDSLVFPISRAIDVLSLGSVGKNLAVVAVKRGGDPA